MPITKILIFIFIYFITINSQGSTLIHNIHGYTSTNTGLLQFEGLLFDEQGKILKTLSQKAVTDLLATAAKLKDSNESLLNIIDGKGKYLLPGLIDAHGHVLSYGEALATVDLVGTTSAEEAVKRVADFVANNADKQWIIGRGWNQVLWKSKEFPDAEMLDKVAPGKPIVLGRIDGHANWLNNTALKLAGIDKNTLDPAGGEILRDDQGNPTGVLVDNAMDMVWDKIPPLSKEQREAYILKALQALASEGITSVHDAGVSTAEINSFKNLATNNQLIVRIYAMLGVNSTDYLKSLNKGIEKSLFDDRLSVQSIKISIDGALGSRGAALDAPYSDRKDTSGLMLHTEQETEALTLQAMKAGFQVNSHAIGDRGNRLLLDIFSKYPEYRHLRHRIEHAQIVHLEDIPRFKELHVIPSMQPTHATSDMNMAKDRVGEKRLKGSYAWRKFLNLDVVIASGSDFPVEPANPFFGLHAAVTRQSRDNQPDGGWRPEEKMTREEALRSFTLDAAYAGHQEKVLGSLEKGKWADFILIDQDYFAIDEKDIWKINVLQTWQAGKRVY
ncbi:MAG: amidohydrolase [Gammaproteobacteria bacterium]|nr:MAG: amidohydrolase [Gammaproteobacteria bacterium]